VIRPAAFALVPGRTRGASRGAPVILSPANFRAGDRCSGRSRSFGRSFARELAPRRIRVNTITPGPIETPIHAKAGMQPGEMASIAQQFVPLARMGQAEEVASVALFLASEDASYMTRGDLFVDGGLVEL
jgi:Enoyl-(Acyl carrier protein) reductase